MVGKVAGSRGMMRLKFWTESTYHAGLDSSMHF